MTASMFLLGILSSLMLAAALFDLASYTIPNLLTGTMFVLFAAFLLALALNGHALGWSSMRLHLLAGALGLAVGIAMFARGWIGGGDAKLFAVACLWLGWNSIYDYAILASLLGGALTLFLLALRQLPVAAFLPPWPWLLRLTDTESGVPYGVALASAALMILPDTDLIRLASAS
jgi:prepilin peptidase CpaA